MSDSVTIWTAACQAPPSTEFSRQEYWSGLPFPSPGDLPDSGMEGGGLERPRVAQLPMEWLGAFEIEATVRPSILLVRW